MKITYRINGENAIRLAARDGLTLRKYTDPIEAAGVVDEDKAREIIAIDPSLIYVHVTESGWTQHAEGVNVSDYFRGAQYLGPDEYDTEPVWSDVEEHQASVRRGGVANSSTYLHWGPRTMYLAGDSDGINLVTIEAISEAVKVAGSVTERELESIIDEAVDATPDAEAVYLTWDEA